MPSISIYLTDSQNESARKIASKRGFTRDGVPDVSKLSQLIVVGVLERNLVKYALNKQVNKIAWTEGRNK